MSTNSQDLEQETQGNGLTAPRVTPAMIEKLIVSEKFNRITDRLTHCTLTLLNGFEVTGESSCVHVDNYDKDVGERIARENAVNEIWPLEGYLLKQKLHEAKQ